MLVTSTCDKEELIEQDVHSRLSLSVSVDGTMSRALIEDAFPDKTEVGLTLVDAGGSKYDNITYNNIKATAAGTSEAQTWTLASDMLLSGTSGTLYGYYPYLSSVTDITQIPVETASQTDYMYAEPVTGLSEKNHEAVMVYKHMMMGVRLNIVRGPDYEGDGIISSVTVTSDGIRDKGTFNARTGEYTAFTDATTSVTRNLSMSLGAGNIDFLVVPIEGQTASLSFNVTVDGEMYSTQDASVTFTKGQLLQWTLTLNHKLEPTVVITGDMTDVTVQQTNNADGTVTIVATAETDDVFVSDGIAVTNATATTSYDENDNLVISLTDITGEVTVTMAGSLPRVQDFDYTGSVQSATLTKGTYQLQCWGAQGGTSYGSSSGAGSKGGYAEGQLTLDETTTLYAFVGGQGSRGSSTTLVNGGWNGGGASKGFTSYSSGDTYGYSYPACGGGATDFATVTSTMSYSSGQTVRSSESLLSRCIVAGGGAGGSYRKTTVTTTTTTPSTTTTSWEIFYWHTQLLSTWWSDSNQFYIAHYQTYMEYEPGGTYKAIIQSPNNDYSSGSVIIILDGTRYDYSLGSEFTLPSFTSIDDQEMIAFYTDSRTDIRFYAQQKVTTIIPGETTTDTSTSSGYSNKSQQGGGTSGIGQYPGTQSAGGNGNGNDGTFGYGGCQTISNYRYASGGAGGGWYGGGTAYSDSSTGYINYSGGGSGFVNTAANASYRPSGYTGLQLDSGTTTAGNTSHPSTSGGTETGHSGNGYARITRLK